MMPSNAKVPLVDMRHATCAKAVDVVSAETSDTTGAAQATHVTAANVTHTGTDVTAAKAAHTATTVSSAATAAAGLCARGEKAAGKHCACQNHHHSSFHDILHLIRRICSAAGPCQTLACSARWTPTSRYNGDENAELFSQLNFSLQARVTQRKRTQNRELACSGWSRACDLSRRIGAVTIAVSSKPVERVIKALDGRRCDKNFRRRCNEPTY
jgi:hypothetical protein